MLENRSFDRMLGFLYADTGNVSPAGQPFEGFSPDRARNGISRSERIRTGGSHFADTAHRQSVTSVTVRASAPGKPCAPPATRRTAETNTQIIAALQNSALPMSARATSGTGYDYDNGHGFLDINTAFSQLPAAAPSVPVSPASSGGGGSRGGGAIGVGTLLSLGFALMAAIRSSRQTGASPRDDG
jgi:hypothetical protein